jgi:trigger factor
MEINKNKLNNNIELEITISNNDFKEFVEKGAKKIAEQLNIEGFRPGKVPVEVAKKKVGEMSILEEAAQIAIRKTVNEAISNNIEEGENIASQPQVEIVKLAPDNDFVYKVKIELLPKVKLGEYKGLNIKTKKAEVKDEEIEASLKKIQEMRAKETIKLSPAVKGDKLIVDISLFFDKVPVDGGQSKNVQVILGEEYFIKGFDQQLLGATKGEVKKFVLDYPKDHHQAHLAGRKVNFKVDIKEVYNREIPELNDELAKAWQLPDLAALKKAVADNIKIEKDKKLELENEKNLADALINKSSFDDISASLIERESKAMVNEMKKNLEAQGAKFEDYLNHIKKTENELMLDFSPEATKRIKFALLLQEVAKKEEISVSDDEVKKMIEDLKKQYSGQAEALKVIESEDYQRNLKHNLLNDKIINQLKEWNYERSGDKQKS